jgi:hypothetical protein
LLRQTALALGEDKLEVLAAHFSDISQWVLVAHFMEEAEQDFEAGGPSYQGPAGRDIALASRRNSLATCVS